MGPFKISLDWVLTLTTQPSTKTFLQPHTKSDQPLFSPNNIHDYHQEKGYKNWENNHQRLKWCFNPLSISISFFSKEMYYMEIIISLENLYNVWEYWT